MILEPIIPTILSVQFIPNADPEIIEAYGGNRKKHSSLGLITVDQDDPTYVALDEATKNSPVDVIFAKSFYAGSRHASGKLSGEILGVLAGADPDIVQEGMRSAIQCLETDACFYSANDDGSIAVFPHVISSLGYYLSAQAGLSPGDSMAYLVAPPLEATYSFDQAMKAANVRKIKLFTPPTETNFAAIWLGGSLNSCQAAAEAFLASVVEIGSLPRAM